MQRPKKSVFLLFFYFFPIYLAASAAKYGRKGAAIVEKGLGRVCGKGLEGFGNLDFDFEILEMQVFGAWGAPKTSISCVLEAKLSSRDQVGC